MAAPTDRLRRSRPTGSNPPTGHRNPDQRCFSLPGSSVLPQSACAGALRCLEPHIQLERAGSEVGWSRPPDVVTIGPAGFWFHLISPIQSEARSSDWRTTRWLSSGLGGSVVVRL